MTPSPAGVVSNRDLARLAATAAQPVRRLMRDIRTIRGERVSVHSDRQAEEAGTIIDTIEGTYGIDIDAAGTVSAVRADYGGAPLGVRRSVVRRHWKLRELRALLRAEIERRLEAGAGHVEPEVEYQSLTGVDRLHTPSHPADFYFRADALVMIAVSQEALAELTPESLEERFGGPGELLRSRYGRRARLHTYPEQGVAFVDNRGTVAALEVFPPTTLERYRDEIWWEPPAFVR